MTSIYPTIRHTDGTEARVLSFWTHNTYAGVEFATVEVEVENTILKIAMVSYDDGARFTLGDWQGPQPSDANEIVDYPNWYDEEGRPAILIQHGLECDNVTLPHYLG